MIKTDNTSEQIPLSGRLEEFRTALQDEIKAVKKMGNHQQSCMMGI